MTHRAPAWAGPADADGYAAHQLMLVRTGRKSRAPGVSRCTDCREPYLADDSGLTWCPDCRTGHRRRCQDCRQPMPNTREGDRLCDCCRTQITLF